jgi:hypothetical protein
VTGVALGAAIAASRGAHGPSWGTAAAFPAVAVLFAIGAWKEREGEEMTHLLRLTLGFTAGFLLTTVPLTLFRVAELSSTASEDVLAELARMRRELVLRWAVIALGLPVGIAALWARRSSRGEP